MGGRREQGRQRLANYDLVKVTAIFMVVAVHMLNVVQLVQPGDLQAFRIHEVVRTFLLTSNGLFFMVSGRFLLEHYEGNIGRFYWKRIVKIGIPVLCASLFYFVYVYGRNGMGMDFWKRFLKDFLQSHIQGYFWFVYALAGFYLAVPFLAPMFKALKVREKQVLLGLTLVYFLVQNLYQIFGLEMVFTSYPFYSWIFYCVLGYLLDTIGLTRRQRWMLMGAGGIAFLVSAWEVCFWERENPAIHNYSVTMILITAAVYLALTEWGKKMPRSIGGGISILSGASFYLYLMHGLTQNLLAGWAGENARGWGTWLGLSAASFFLAAVLGGVLEALYAPVSSFLLKAGRRKQG